ncbi:MAG: NAD(P)H-dependent oxidoreductase [Xanthobacteraceae bacterium]
MLTPKILVIPGSLRIGSHNGRLAALAAKELALADAEVTRISLQDYPLPLFDTEMTGEVATPQNAVQLRRMVEAHHGVFMTSPEYSASVTPLLKNTIDWLSRPRARGEPPYEIFKDRVFAIGAASPGADGGVRSLMALRQILELGCGALVIPEQITVANAGDAFDEMEDLKDDSLAASLKAMVCRLVELARAMG